MSREYIHPPFLKADDHVVTKKAKGPLKSGPFFFLKNPRGRSSALVQSVKIYRNTSIDLLFLGTAW